jgi:hypothetical protein
MSFKVPEQHMSNIHAITNHAEVQAHFSKTRGNAQPQKHTTELFQILQQDKHKMCTKNFAP